MIFRQAQTQEINFIFEEGYKEWSRNRTFEQYCIDNGKEDAYGTRYVIDVNNEIVSSLILLNLADINGKRTYGIGSVVTSRNHKGKGYATELLNNCIKQVAKDNSAIFLYSEINPNFYEKFGFRVLPSKFQKDEKSTCMVSCKYDIWNELLNSSVDLIPNHF